MKKLYCWLVLASLVTVLWVGCAAPSAPAPAPAPVPSPAPAPSPGAKSEPITLKVMTFLPQNQDTNKGFFDLVDKINTAAKGELTLKYMGGPEAISAVDQIDAVRRGVAHLSIAAASYIQPLVPEHGILGVSQVEPWKEREVGFYDLLVELTKKINMQYLGRSASPKPFYMFTTYKVETLNDFVGHKIRTAQEHASFLDALGASKVTVPKDDVYTALQRGLIEGVISPMDIKKWGWHEVLKYFVKPMMHDGNNCVIVANLDMWNQLPKHLQTLISDAAAKQERDWYTYYRDVDGKQMADTIAAGVKPIELSPSQAARLVDLVQDAAWGELFQKSPKYGPMIRDMVTR